VKEFVEQGEAILAASENEGDTIDTVIPSVPGICYTRLLSELHGSTLTGSLLIFSLLDNSPYLQMMMSYILASIFYVCMIMHKCY
jgi:hypothetical protein